MLPQILKDVCCHSRNASAKDYRTKISNKKKHDTIQQTINTHLKYIVIQFINEINTNKKR